MARSAASCLLFDVLFYRVVFPRVFPTHVGGRFVRANVLKATASENLLITPFVYLPGFYVYKELVAATAQQQQRPSPSAGAARAPPPAAVVTRALTHYRNEFGAQNASSLAFWVPVNYVTFALVPIHLRVAFVSVAAVGYVGVLSAVTQCLGRRANDGVRCCCGAADDSSAV